MCYNIERERGGGGGMGDNHMVYGVHSRVIIWMGLIYIPVSYDNVTQQSNRLWDKNYWTCSRLGLISPY